MGFEDEASKFVTNVNNLLYPLLIVILSALYYHYIGTFKHFEKLGIPFMKPRVIVGNIGPLLTAKESFHDFQLGIYNKFKGNACGGIFEGRRPVIYAIDPNVIKGVMISEFYNFEDRNTFPNKEPMYLRRSLLDLKGAEWKGLRCILTPAFSSARLKNMLPLIQLCTDQMVTFLKQYENKEVEMKDTIGHLTLEVIGACAFGIKCDALNNENSHFIKVAEKFHYLPLWKRLCILTALLLRPQLLSLLRISFLNLEATDELIRMLKVVKAERRASGVKQNDFLQLLLDAAEKDKTATKEIKSDKTDTEETISDKTDTEETKSDKTDTEETKSDKMDAEGTKSHKYLDEDTIDAQSLLFLIAGYETSSTLLSFAIHMLATKPDLQEKLRSHVLEMTEGKEMSYDLLSQLTYLEAFLLETLRIYPPIARVYRIVTKPCTLPATNIPLHPGDVVAIPVYGLHMDPDIYPDPAEFRPERFMGDEKKERPAHLFLPFGAGPRNCIGLRFAMVSAKLAIVTLLKNFKFCKCEKTIDPIVFDKRALLLKAHGGVWVRLQPL